MSERDPDFNQLSPEEKNETYRRTEEVPENGVRVSHTDLPPETLDMLIESFILREGTDYGVQEASLERKIADIRRQFDRRELTIVFDLTTETCSILPTRKLPKPTP